MQPLFVEYLFDESFTTLDHRLIQFQIDNSVLKGSPVVDLHIKVKGDPIHTISLFSECS